MHEGSTAQTRPNPRSPHAASSNRVDGVDISDAAAPEPVSCRLTSYLPCDAGSSMKPRSNGGGQKHISDGKNNRQKNPRLYRGSKFFFFRFRRSGSGPDLIPTRHPTPHTTDTPAMATKKSHRDGKKWAARGCAAVACTHDHSPGTDNVPGCNGDLPRGNREFPRGNREFPQGHCEFPAGDSKFPQGRSDLPAGDSKLRQGNRNLLVCKRNCTECNSDPAGGKSDLTDGNGDRTAPESDCTASKRNCTAGHSDCTARERNLTAGDSDFTAGNSDCTAGDSKFPAKASANAQADMTSGAHKVASEARKVTSGTHENASGVRNGASDVRSRARKVASPPTNGVDGATAHEKSHRTPDTDPNFPTCSRGTTPRHQRDRTR